MVRRFPPLLLVLYLLGACDSASEPEALPDVAALEIVGVPDSLLVGSPVQLSVIAQDADGDTLADAPISWASEDESVIAVDPDGTATGVSAGSGRVVASSTTASDTVSFRIVLPDFVLVTAGGGHTCTLSETAAALCWGENERGQLGIGAAGGIRMRPTLVSGGHSFESLSAGLAHTCGVDMQERGWCWGANGLGQLGIGLREDLAAPIEVSGLLPLVQLRAGAKHTCGITTFGSVYCWGDNSSGQLGDGSVETRGIPGPVRDSGEMFTDLAVGTGHTCGLVSGSAPVYCWGNNESGQLGIGSAGGVFQLPQQVDLDDRTRLNGGLWPAAGRHNCGNRSSRIHCWGANESGQIGIGATSESVPAPVGSTGSGFAEVGAGSAHTCAVQDSTRGSNMYCWGDNQHGQLGIGSSGGRELYPALVTDTLPFQTLAVGHDHTCGISGGTIYCWGRGEAGQLGRGSREDSAVPVAVED